MGKNVRRQKRLFQKLMKNEAKKSQEAVDEVMLGAASTIFSDSLGNMVDEIKERHPGEEERVSDFLSALAVNLEKLNQMQEQAGEPDTYGCDSLFAHTFVIGCPELVKDFPFVFKDFLVHELANMDKYPKYEYARVKSDGTVISDIMAKTGMNMMMNAYVGGSKYTKALFVYLFKTYYKKEYMVLKRFGSLSYHDAIELSGMMPNFLGDADKEEDCMGRLARIMFMAKAMGIRLAPDCYAIYTIIDTGIENEKSVVNDFDAFREGLAGKYAECFEEVNAEYDRSELNKREDMFARFTDLCYKWLGINPSVYHAFDAGCEYHHVDLSASLMLLKELIPYQGYFEADELAFAHAVLKRVWASVAACEVVTMTYFGNLFPSYTISDIPEEIRKPLMFCPENIQFQQDVPVKEQRKQEEKPIVFVDDREKLLAEIRDLRLKVHTLENENHGLRDSISDYKSLKEENKVFTEKFDSLNKETAALRSYVYGLTEEDVDDLSSDYEGMKKVLNEKKVVIIGGHSNWTQKMKSEFPKWKFIPKVAGSNFDTSVVDGADYVYFFSDMISHGTYYRFLNVIREHNICFGYIHGVNIERNVSHIYDDMIKGDK